MDAFGISPAVQAVVEVLFRSMRQTGRTTALLNAVAPGDRVLFLTHKEAARFQNLLRERGKQGVTCTVVNLNDAALTRSEGRTYLDHNVVEKIHRDSIESSMRYIRFLEDMLSSRPIDEGAGPVFDDPLRRWRDFR